jgi:hypothetical protein
MSILIGPMAAFTIALRELRAAQPSPRHAAPLDQTNPLPMNPNFLDRL